MASVPLLAQKGLPLQIGVWSLFSGSGSLCLHEHLNTWSTKWQLFLAPKEAQNGTRGWPLQPVPVGIPDAEEAYQNVIILFATRLCPFLGGTPKWPPNGWRVLLVSLGSQPKNGYQLHKRQTRIVSLFRRRETEDAKSGEGENDPTWPWANPNEIPFWGN